MSRAQWVALLAKSKNLWQNFAAKKVHRRKPLCRRLSLSKALGDTGALGGRGHWGLLEL